MAILGRRFAFSATFLAMSVMVIPSASAGPLIDWLFGRRSAAPMPCASCGATSEQSYRTVISYSVPTSTTYAPSYRTVWQRVPVTNYRPTVSYDPTTRQNVTKLQPCSSYEWQARRVPTRLYRPLLGRLFGTSRPYDQRTLFRAPTSTYAYTSPRYLNPNSAASAWTNCPPAGRILSSQGEYYSPGATTMGANEGWEDAVRNRDNQDAPAVSPDTEIPATDYSKEKDAGGVDPENMQYQFSPREKTGPRSASNTPLNGRRPRPIPDPDATFQSDRPNPPQLIRPRVKTAVAGPEAGAFVLISWPERTAGRVAPAVLHQPTSDGSKWRAPTNKTTDWQDDGWRSVR